MSSENFEEVTTKEPAKKGFFPKFMGPYEPDDASFIAAEPEEQKEMMRRWFLARYCDPAEDLPYNGREGGYIYVNGGPHDPEDVLPERFSETADNDMLQELIADLHSEVGQDWSPRSFDDDYEEDEYDERFDIELITRDQPIDSLTRRLAQAKSLLDLQGGVDAMALVQQLAYSSLISALESFLWETIVYWVEHDETALRNMVTRLPALKDEPITLGSIFDQYDGLKGRVKGYLQNLVWHRWEKVAQLFKFGLDVKLPSVRPFEEALIKKHDIVHRSGHDKEGNSIAVVVADVAALSAAIQGFADEVNQRLAARPTPPDSHAEASQ